MTAIVRDYLYDVFECRVIDGDTVKLVLDLGLDPITATRVVRLTKTRTIGINSAEMDDGGEAAKQFVDDWIRGRTLIARTFKLKPRVGQQRDKTDKYGRLIAQLFDVKTGEAVVDELLANGLTVEKKY